MRGLPGDTDVVQRKLLIAGAFVAAAHAAKQKALDNAKTAGGMTNTGDHAKQEEK